MSTTNHTPGPWKVIEGGYIAANPTAAHAAKYPKNKRVHIGHCCAFSEATREEVEANLALWAAAPELVTALRNAQRALNTVECSLSSMQLDVISDIARVLAKCAP